MTYMQLYFILISYGIVFLRISNQLFHMRKGPVPKKFRSTNPTFGRVQFIFWEPVFFYNQLFHMRTGRTFPKIQERYSYRW